MSVKIMQKMLSIVVVVLSLSCVQPFCDPIACQVPLSMGFPSKNTGVGSLSLPQGILPSHGWNPGLLLGRWIVYH